MSTASRPEMPLETMEDGSQEILSLKDLLRIVYRRSWVIVLCTFVFTAMGLGYSLLQTPLYEATARLLLVTQDNIRTSPGDPMSETETIQTLGETMAEAMQNRALAEKVVRDLELDKTPQEVLDGLNVEVIPNTNLIDISVRDPDPQAARELVNAVAEAATEEEIPLNRPMDNSLGATLWETAETPDEPVEPVPARDGLIGLILGLMAGVGLVFLLEYLDGSLRSPEQAERVSGAPVLGIIPNQKLPKRGDGDSRELPPARTGEDTDPPSHNGLNGHLITTADPTGPAADAYRVLRSMLLHSSGDHSPKIILLAGVGGGDGAATCANLGVALAQAGKSTLILDCGFRDSATETLFGIQEAYGLAEVLIGARDMEEVSSEPLPGLKVIPSGLAPSDPAALLETERFPRLLAAARERFDYVLIDAPPLGAASDTVTLSAYSDGVLLVTRARETSAEAIRQAARGIRTTGSSVLGVVVGGVELGTQKNPRRTR